MNTRFKNVLVVVKKTAHDNYMQMKAQGNAPVAVRWDRLLERHKCHTNCIQRVCDTLDKLGVNYSLIGRDEMHRGSLYDKDFVLTVGGDGTALNVASFLDGNVPIAGINSDPATVNKDYRSNRSDERKSKGALCAMTSLDVDEFLPKIVFGSFPPNSRTRIQCLVRNTYNEIRLPPALNDILIAHTSPAAVTRFRVSKYEGRVMPAFQEVHQEKIFSFPAWSSGMWICTATGSSAAMHSAGGDPMDPYSTQLQYKIREPLLDSNFFDQNNLNIELDYQEKEDESVELFTNMGHGFLESESMLYVTYNCQHGAVFVDGCHVRQSLELGDEIKIDSHAPQLRIFDKESLNE